MSSKRYEEIEIRGFVANDHSEATLLDLARRIEQVESQPGATNDGVRQCVARLQRPVFADDVVAALADMEDRGVRVVFVPVDGPGGHIDGSRRIYDALRGFSDRGGFVVTCLSGARVASSAPWIALAGDLVFAVPESRVFLHSASGVSSAAANQHMAALLYERTALPAGSAEECLSRAGFAEDGGQRAVEIPLDEIIKNGFADHVCEFDGARAWAHQAALLLEAGMRLPCRRHEPGGALWQLRERQAHRAQTFVMLEAPGPRASWAGAPDAAPASFAVTADKIAAGQIKTTNYAEDGSGNPTSGAKLDHKGLALKVAPSNLQIGDRVLSTFGMVQAQGSVLLVNPVLTNYAILANRNIASVARYYWAAKNQWVLRFTFETLRVEANAPVIVTISGDPAVTWNTGAQVVSRATLGGAGVWLSEVWVGTFWYSNAWKDPQDLAGVTVNLVAFGGA
jgi:ATP-dependent protease ClpP protease subunit